MGVQLAGSFSGVHSLPTPTSTLGFKIKIEPEERSLRNWTMGTVNLPFLWGKGYPSVGWSWWHNLYFLFLIDKIQARGLMAFPSCCSALWTISPLDFSACGAFGNVLAGWAVILLMLWVAFLWPFVIYWNSPACFLLREAWNEGGSLSTCWLWYQKTNFWAAWLHVFF